MKNEADTVDVIPVYYQMREPAYLEQKQPIFNKLLFKTQTSYADGDLRFVVSAGGRLTINASPPGWTLRSVADREQFGCDQG
jgi:hypothetical protein